MNRMVPSRTLQILLLVVLSTSFIITADAMTIVAQTGDPWIVAIDRSYAPHEFWEDETAKGFNTDIIHAIAIEMNRPVVWVPLQWTDAYNSLLNGSVDSLCMVNTPEREILFDFSEPFLNLTLRIFVNIDASGIFNISDLAEHTVAVEDGDIAHIKLVELSPNATVVPVESQEEAIRLVELGEVTAAFCNSYAGYYAILKNSYLNVKIVGTPVSFGERCIAVLEGNTVLRTEINTALEDVFESGEYDILVERWFGTYPYALPNQGLIQTLQLMGAFFLFAVFGVGIILSWNWSLRATVKKSTRQLHLLGDLFRHDLRNIGQGTFSSLEILAMREGLSIQDRELLETAISSLERADMLTTDYSALEILSTPNIRRIELILSSALNPVVERIRQEFSTFTFNIDYNHPDNLVIMTVDLFENAMLRILRFLIARIIESSSEKVIDIRTITDSGCVQILIGNRGPGLPDSQKIAALERYKGSVAPLVGLDLSIVHAVIRASKGTVDIHDTVPDDWRSGAVFKIQLQIPGTNKISRIFQSFKDRCRRSTN